MKIYLFLLCLILLSAPLYASETGPDGASGAYTKDRYNGIAERFDSLFSRLSKYRRFNGNVLVSTDGNIVYENSFGYSDYRKRTRLSLGSLFEIASVSKQFTAMGIMMLHDDGRLGFDDPVTKFFPDFPYKKVTVRHLLTHRSGLPDYLKFSPRLINPKGGYLTNDRLMEFLVRSVPDSLFEAGTAYRYSNTGYAVLAKVIENVSGKRYDEFMSERIFAPLGMTS